MTERVAAIDCGTNSIRLLVADLDGVTQTDLTRRMEIVRLGEGVDRTGRLSEAPVCGWMNTPGRSRTWALSASVWSRPRPAAMPPMPTTSGRWSRPRSGMTRK